MATTAQDLRQLRETRYSAEYIVQDRFRRAASWGEHKAFCTALDLMYGGRYGRTLPDQTGEDAYLKVQNYVRSGLDDIMNLACEALPTLSFPPKTNKSPDIQAADIQSAIGNGYWAAYDDESNLVPMTAYDLAGTGLACWLSYPKVGHDYPAHLRLNPRGCFPTIHGGTMVDMLYTTTLHVNEIAALYPDLQLFDVFPPDDEKAELIQFWTRKETVYVVWANHTFEYNRERTTKQVSEIVATAKNEIGMVPIAWAKLPTGDDKYKGIFDEQVREAIRANDQLFQLILDGTDKAVYSGYVADNIDAPEGYGPGQIYHPSDPTRPASMTPVVPAQFSNQVFGVMQLQEESIRGTTAMPRGRQGEAGASIISAAGIEALQGALSSKTKGVNRLIAKMRREQTEIDRRIDVAYLDYLKPLIFPVGGRFNYRPSTDIKLDLRAQVTYGLGSGLSQANTLVAVGQAIGMQLVSRQTGRRQISWITSSEDEEKQRDLEATKDLMLQSGLANSDPMALLALYRAQARDGKPFDEALDDYEQAQQAAMAAQQAAQQAQLAQTAQGPGLGPTPAGLPGAPIAPESVVTQQTALEKGAMPGAPGLKAAPVALPGPPPPPLSNLLIRGG